MNEQITFLAFASNDCPDEQLRIDLFLRSLLEKQDGEKHLVMLMDLSEKGNEFKIKEHSRLIVIREPTPSNKIYPAYIRNTLALKATTDFICHVNSDCYYSPKFAQILLKELHKRKDHLIMCCRRNINEQQWKQIKSGEKDIAAFSHVKKDSPHACGDCQAISRALFLKNKGYHGLIEGDKSKKRDRKKSFGEDTQLEHKYNKKKRMLDESGAWIIHMFHTKRHSKEAFIKKNKKKNKKK